ncbi:MAG: alpha-mannosidase [Armatimonadetes bacterium]|nr:alpha-mannosidase [Armatimonadota bacterium]
MNPTNSFEKIMSQMAVAEGAHGKWYERIRAELDFAARMADANPDRAAEWRPIIEQAAALVADGLKGGGGDLPALVAEAEKILAPLSPAAKEYAIYCAGHAHIDMNWMWSWPETVAVTHDTFSTMDRLMDEFPSFHFSQSQASVYHAMEKYAPEMFERIRRRIQEGRWECTACQWVEGSKNLASGEILCRHLLYTRRWFRDHLGLPFDAVKIDWEPDTFGHCWTLPGILARGGISRYYHHRSSGPQLQAMSSGSASQLYWWEGKDGSRVLAYDDSPNGYNCEINPHMTHLLFAIQKHTGLKKILWVYGVGDHGGGPTRRHLRAAQDMESWPVWPRVLLTTTDAFFSDVEREIAERGLELPVHKGELNFVFEGCYTSESRIKFANRSAENDLVDTEIIALCANRLCGMEYPSTVLEECWQRAMFNQFHDILPGSGVKETVEYALALFQENLANTGMIRTRSLRALAGMVDTSALEPAALPTASDMGLGAGVGNGAWWGGVSSLGEAEPGGEVFVIFNPAPFQRDEMVWVKIWNRPFEGGRISVRDSQGKVLPAQIMGSGHYWGHQFVDVAFPAAALPPVGYRSYVVEPVAAQPEDGPRAYLKELGRPIYRLGYVCAQTSSPVAIGNDLLEITICPESGGITSLIDKATGKDLVPEGEVLGVIQREQEVPHGMTAWQLAPISDRVEPLAGATLDMVSEGPNVAAVRLSGKHNESEYALNIRVLAGVPRIDFELNVNWLERGDPRTGVPALRVSFPLNVSDGAANFEIASGHIEREADGEEVPALNWADLTGKMEDGTVAGATLVNDCKYGHQAFENGLRLTLLRSSYDPDPLPEIGRHEIRFALVPHVGAFDPAAAIKAGYAFNHRIIPVATTAHTGDLPAEGSALEVLTDNVMISGIKQAEDGDGLVIRLYEFGGIETEARVRLHSRIAAPDSAAVETDMMEQPLANSTASMSGDTLSVKVPAFGIATVKIG